MGVKISNLPAVVAPALTDIFPVVQGGVTYKETVTQLAALLASTGTFATYTSPSIANHIAVFTDTDGNLGSDVPTAINGGNIAAGLSGTAGELHSYPAIASTGKMVLAAISNSGNYDVEITNEAHGQASTYAIPDCGQSAANFIVSIHPIGQTVAVGLNTATPGDVRSLEVGISNVIPVMTSGDLHGLQGDCTVDGASGGTAVACVGAYTATGTLSSTHIGAGVNGSVDVSGGAINGATLYGIYGSMIGTAPTQTSMVNTHGIGFTNNTAAVLNSQVYLSGNATYALEIANATAFVATPAGASASGNLRTLRVYINGAAYYLLAAQTYS
jgi:hypothetical protein